MRTFVIIPTFCEGTVLRQTLEQVLKASGVDEIVVVDDGSSDYLEIAGMAGNITVLRHSTNLGQGAALQTGLDYALAAGADILLTFDADGQMDAGDIGKFRDLILRQEVQVVLGSRFVEGATVDSIPPIRKLVLRLAVKMTRLMTGLRITDTHNGFRAFSREAAGVIQITQNRMAHASEILHQIRARRLTYQEVPVSIRYTEHSLQKGQRIHNAFNILWELLFG